MDSSLFCLCAQIHSFSTFGLFLNLFFIVSPPLHITFFSKAPPICTAWPCLSKKVVAQRSHGFIFKTFSICRRPFCSSHTKRKKMQNPLDMTTYRVGAETYRRNCPLEGVSTTTPAAGAAFGATADECAADEEEKTLSPTSSGRSSTSDVLRSADFAASDYESPEKKFCVSIDANAKTAITAEIACEIGEIPSREESAEQLIVVRKTVEVISAEDGWVYTEKATKEQQLVGTVRRDEAKQCFYDSLLVPTDLVGLIRGKQSANQRQIEQENKCKIEFPKKHATGAETEIKFFSTESAFDVQACGEALKKMEAKARKAAAPTHFISVPIFDPNFRTKYSEFVDKICSDETLPEQLRNKKMFVKPNKLHLTVNVLKLFTEKEVQETREFLDKQFQSDKIRDILERCTNGQFRIKFTALQPMVRQLPKSCRVIFAQTEAAKDLQDLFNTLDDTLDKAGKITRREGEDVLLHMTVINTKFLYQGFKPIDATKLLERYEQLNSDDFPPVDVDELHLCEMRGNSNVNDLNGYVSVHSIKFGTAAN